MDVTVNDAPERSRFEAVLDGEVVGFAAYQKTGELIVFTHTEVDPSMGGRGVGSALVRGALDQVREWGLKALPICPFVVAWMQRNPEYAELDYRAGRRTDLGVLVSIRRLLRRRLLDQRGVGRSWFSTSEWLAALDRHGRWRLLNRRGWGWGLGFDTVAARPAQPAGWERRTQSGS